MVSALAQFIFFIDEDGVQCIQNEPNIELNKFKQILQSHNGLYIRKCFEITYVILPY